MSNAQRALWTFLIYTLVGPFFAALAIAAVLALAAGLGLSDYLPGDLPPLAQAAVATFVWSAGPAFLTALMLAAMVWRSGTFSWILAAAAAVIAFALAAAVLPFGQEDARPYLAFLAGLIAIIVRAVLVRARVLA